MEQQPRNDLEQARAEEERVGLLEDFWYFLLGNMKWWLVPILVVLLLMGLLMLLSTTSLAPFIYPLF